MSKKKQKNGQFTKTELLMAVDSAIAQLVTVRTILDHSLGEGKYSVPGAPAQGCQHTRTTVPGFGEPEFCLDCEQSVGVSPTPAE